MADYFDDISAPTTNESAGDFADRIQTELSASVARDNEVAELSQLDRLLMCGPGRFSNGGAAVTVVSATVRIANGYYYAGPGVAVEDADYFAGLRLRQIDSEYSYIELTGADAPPLNKSAGTWGYISWYGDVVWFDSEQTTAEQVADLAGRWCIGKIITDGSGAVSVAAGTTKILENVFDLAALVAALTEAVENLEALSGGSMPYWGALKKTSSDATTIPQAIADAVSAGGGTTGSGTTTTAGAARDETAVNVLHHQFLLLINDDTALDTVPGYRSDTYSPGRGHYADLIDTDYTTVTIDNVAHVIGDAS
jgi:hypothetical protein